MSGPLGVPVLLSWVCLWLSWQAQGALIISGIPKSLETNGAARLLQKRNADVGTVEVHSFTVDCTVRSRFARTVMTSTAINKGNAAREISFEVELPKTAFISNFSMEIEEQVYVGQVKEKEKAKQQYDKAVSAGKTAGLVKASGRKMEKFSVSVNIASNSKVTFVLTYEELLQRTLGQYEIVIRVKPKEPVQEFKIVSNIFEPQGISYVDAHATFLTNDLLPLVEKTVTDKKAHISFSPTIEQQRKCPDCPGTIIDGDFIIKYDVNRDKSLGDIQIANGYFVHFFAPKDLTRLPKNVVFVIDRSGSMSGTKMQQTQEAMIKILADLHPEDHFGIIQFDSSVDSWRNSLSRATEENISEAMTYVVNIVIAYRESTDINAAVLKAVDMLVTDRKAKRLPEKSIDMIILLTDGAPTSGETRIPLIQENVRNAIGGNMSLYGLGFGNDVDYAFLDVMSRENKGLARRIYTGSDAALQLQGFYDEVSSPLLLDVDLRYPDNAVESLTTNHFSQLFKGSEITVAGRLTDNDIDNFPVEVYGQGFDDFSEMGQFSAVDWSVMYPEDDYIFGDFTERLWAYLTIQQLLEKSKTGAADEKANATAKALDMSLQYSFVTPLTSMVVTKPEADDSPMIADKLTEEQRQQAERSGGVSDYILTLTPNIVWFHSTDSVASAIRYKEPTYSAQGQLPGSAGVRGYIPKEPTDFAQGQLPGSAGVRGYIPKEPTDFAQGQEAGSRGVSHYRPSTPPTYFVDGDPHFMIELPDRNDALCFNINDKPGTIFNLVRDPVSGILVNGQIIGDKKIPPDGVINTYFYRFGITHWTLGVRLEVNTEFITVYQAGERIKLLWSAPSSLKGPNVDMVLTKDRSLMVTLKDSVKFVILLHKVWEKHPYHRDYLGFYTLDSHLLSPSAHGLLGQFYHGIEYEVSDLRPGEVPEKPDATMFVKGQQLNVTRGWQRDFRNDVKNGENVPCWFIHNNGTGIIDGNASDYIVSGLFKTT
ncbi:inter-alpha-trypsin inhibitor heavy chain H3-like isoform X1 [Takifugu flavidus]|uniref:inter-alpha-trypsin inhibitor heavy chain H3-like isoform X1 n=1 Tax=Takifugu flavidus TaxID=433684 RepID=UPI0025441A28|nr:inter-alpha-trypsin inhibitor heavy chain H3-like isoform X1 [Takifugu flavidus]